MWFGPDMQVGATYAVILSMFYKREVLVKLEYSFVTIFLRWGKYVTRQEIWNYKGV